LPNVNIHSGYIIYLHCIVLVTIPGISSEQK